MSQLRRLTNPHKLCNAAWHGQQSFFPFPLCDPHNDPPLQTGHRLVVRHRDLVSPCQRHITDVFLWGTAFQYPYWYASAAQPLHQACSVWWLVAYNEDITPLQAVMSWKHPMVMTSENRMVTSPSPEMGVSEHTPMTSWCPKNMTGEHGMVTSPNPETDVSEHRPMTWCPQNMPGSWPVSTEWLHHPVQRLMSVNTDQWHDVPKTCQDHDQWARNGDFIQISEHRPMTCCPENMPSAWSVNTDQRHHTILKTCLSMISEHRPMTSHYPENIPWSWSVNTDQWHMPSWKHALTMTSEHRMQKPPSPKNMTWSWSANTYQWCHTVRKKYHDYDQ